MKLLIAVAVVIGPFLLTACPTKDGDPAARPNVAIESIHTELGEGSCRKEIDKSDPNETPYLVCPGVGGYTLILRRVDAGRSSIDIVDPSQRRFPLEYQEFVTRHMSTLDSKAEWRVATKNGKQAPVALIVRVQARENNASPAMVTRTFLAVAKITPSETCVTDRDPEGAKPDAEARTAADSAQTRPCVPPQPPMTADGVLVR